MNELPRGWAIASIGEICEPSQYGFTAKAKPSGDVHFLRTTDITSGDVNWGSVPYCDVPKSEVEKYLLKDGDVVISRAGSVGYSHVLRNPKRSVFASYLIRFRPLVSADYFGYFLKTPAYWDAISEQSLGIAVQNVNATKLAEIPIPIAPAAEQDRIVEKLEELLSDLDAGVAELKTAQRKVAQYRQSLLKAAVEGALTADWRAAQVTPQETGAELLQRILISRRARWEQSQLARLAEQGKVPPKGWQAKYPEPVAADLTDLPALPKGWAWATVDQCAVDEDGITDGPFGSNLKSEHYTESGPGVIRLQNIGDGRFLGALAHISEERYERLRKHAVIEGDVIVAMLGEVLPRSCAVPVGIAPAIVKADCARVRLNPELVPPALAVAVLNAEPTRQRVNRLVKGVGRPRVNLGHIRSIALPLPPRAEQDRILDILSVSLQSCEGQNLAIERAFALSAAQRKNILKAAFVGQLVPQDPTDEPASELLARLLDERAKQVQQPRVRKAKQAKEITLVASRLIDVLAEAGDWVPAQEAFRRCGVTDGTSTDQIEALYAELRALDKAGRLKVEPVTDAQGRKRGDKLKLEAG